MSTMRELKARAQLLKPVIKVGHDGLSANLLTALDQALADHGLVKVRFTDHKDERREMARELAERSGSAIVLLVGHTVTLHRAPAAG